MRRLIAAGILVLGAVIGMAHPAAAHTSLVTSTPTDGDIVERAPTQMALHFATAIEPDSLRLDLRRGGGTDVGRLTLENPDGPAASDMVASLPTLEPDVYVVAWASVGADGHRATGEVAFGVGAVALADLRSAAAGGGGFDPLPLAGGIARWCLVAALALAAGGTLALRWSRRAEGDLAELVARRAASAVHTGLLLGAVFLVIRVGIVMWATLDVASGSIGDRLGAARTAPVTAALVVAAVIGFGAFRLRRLYRSGAVAIVDLATTAALAALAVSSAALGHAGASDKGAPVLLAAGIHGLAAAAWLGPLLIAGLVVRNEEWRSARPRDRSDFARAAGRAVAPVAAGSLVALAVTGPVLALMEGAWSDLSGRFQTTLIVKAALVIAVVLPLGALHDWELGWMRGRRRMTRADGSGPLRTRTLAAEALALALVVAGGAGLATANPLEPVGGDNSNVLTAVDDPATCAELPAGHLSCYRRYLAKVLDDQGATAAAAELDRLAASVPEVGTECHQLAHDLGNDAVVALGGVAGALADAPPTCWSGYYHGVVELAVAEVGADASGPELQATCESLASEERYGLPHYNCVHGLGHGVMLLTDHDLMGALDLCDRIEDGWESSSCLGGVFMERVISIQAAPDQDDSGGDLLYPCSKVKEDHLDECFLMQSSYFLWKLNYDYAEAFRQCDRAPAIAVETCYRSMGRDIASLSRHDPVLVAERCGMGVADRFAACVQAAALDRALDTLNPDAAGPLCAVLPAAVDQEQCRQAAASTVGSASR